MKRKRTAGNKLWIVLLGFCLFVCVVLDCLCCYLFAIHFAPWRQILAFLSVCSLLTTTTYPLLGRRMSISGSDKFFS
jgi:hypothetical protein